jgi:phosphate transport system ATP-binding protein
MPNVAIDYAKITSHAAAPQEEGVTVIRTENVNAWYGNNQALYNINLDIMKNKITAFIGPSGCGKTTLLKCFNRMNDIIRDFRLDGKILLHGEDLYDKSRKVIQIRQKIGMVFQQPNPFPMTIFDNIRLPISENMDKIGKSRTREIVEEKLKAANLYDEVKSRLNQSALRLSGGQQQRLCIARALSIEPEILLFDEPCSALDHISTLKIENLLLELKERFTIIIVTHNLQQATRIADYVAFFYQGRIEEQGTAQEVFLDPKSKLTANYLHGAF